MAAAMPRGGGKASFFDPLSLLLKQQPIARELFHDFSTTLLAASKYCAFPCAAAPLTTAAVPVTEYSQTHCHCHTGGKCCAIKIPL